VTHTRANIKDKRENKEQKNVSKWSRHANIAMQRTVDNHTYTWLRVRAMREWVGRPPSTGLSANSCDNLDS
jgi:hypothetical protein